MKIFNLVIQDFGLKMWNLKLLLFSCYVRKNSVLWEPKDANKLLDKKHMARCCSLKSLRIDVTSGGVTVLQHSKTINRTLSNSFKTNNFINEAFTFSSTQNPHSLIVYLILWKCIENLPTL